MRKSKILDPKQKNDPRRDDWIQAAQEVYQYKAAAKKKIEKKLRSYADLKRESEWLQGVLRRLEIEQMEHTRILGKTSSMDFSLQELYRQNLQENTAAIEEIEQLISSLSPIEKLLIQCRYMDALPWEEVCREINYSWSQIHRLHSAILYKLAAE